MLFSWFLYRYVEVVYSKVNKFCINTPTTAVYGIWFLLCKYVGVLINSMTFFIYPPPWKNLPLREGIV